MHLVVIFLFSCAIGIIGKLNNLFFIASTCVLNNPQTSKEILEETNKSFNLILVIFLKFEV